MRLEIKTERCPVPGWRSGQAEAGLPGQGPAGHHAGRAADLDRAADCVRHATEHGSSESIWVEVAGDKPKLTVDELVEIDALVFAPWISGPQRRDHKIVRTFRANAVTLAEASAKPAVHAA